MRFAAVALAAIASISSAAAQNTWTEEGTATTTHYTTRTVLRVVQTVFTHNSTTSTTAPSGTGLPHGSGSPSGSAGLTTSLSGTHSAPAATSTSNAAMAAYGVEFGVVALAGFAGLLAL